MAVIKFYILELFFHKYRNLVIITKMTAFIRIWKRLIIPQNIRSIIS